MLIVVIGAGKLNSIKLSIKFLDTAIIELQENYKLICDIFIHLLSDQLIKLFLLQGAFLHLEDTGNNASKIILKLSDIGG